MPVSKINKKWYALIWFALIAASLIRNFYPLYESYAILENPKTAEVLLSVIIDAFISGLLPAALCYLCGSVLYSMAWRRNIRFGTRNDFIYLTMIFTACARLIIGIVEIFSVLNPAIYLVTSVIMDELLLSLAMLLMYFLVLVPKVMNPRTAHRSFNLFASIYLVFQGLNTLLPCFSVFVLSSDKLTLNDQVIDMFHEMGIAFPLPELQLHAAIAGVIIFIMLCVTAVILSQYLKKKAVGFVEPEPPPRPNPYNYYNNPNNYQNGGNPYNGYPFNNGNPYNPNNAGNPYANPGAPNAGDDNPFGDVLSGDPNTKNDGDDNVFDEFDI